MGGCQGVTGGQEGIQGIPWSHRVGLMSLFMNHKAYMPVYISDPDFYCGTDGRTDGTDQPKVAQEVLADLKSENSSKSANLRKVEDQIGKN